MDYTLYKYSLGIALVLMLFFATYFLLAKTPDKPIFGNYVRSRRIMGVALLVLAANYSVHLFGGLRFHNPDAAILMNLSTYCLSYWLFSAAFITLLDDVSQAENPTDVTSHTQWSVVYNLSEKKATVCVNRDYGKSFTFYMK